MNMMYLAGVCYLGSRLLSGFLYVLIFIDKVCIFSFLFVLYQPDFEYLRIKLDVVCVCVCV